ncbi:alpha/beta fold hydrolase [Fulvimarina endophytica]|uniref:alpha/beta fold hydrolase n=1 Tax=Fulvimarina endophytica TaxID=2293836 RepID=UPI001314C378|nr:alpha/beta fold hydrolase [Fulvimarina endophytica]
MTSVLAVLLIVICLLVLLVLASALWTARIARRVEAALPPRGRFLEIGGERLHYLEKGAGPPIVLVHGLTGQLGNFAYALLEPLAVRHRVVLVDRPGSGHSTRKVDRKSDLALQAGMIAEMIDRLDLGRPLVVGHSLGGAVALALALDHPRKVSRLALIAPLTQPTREVPSVFRLLTVRPHWLRVVTAWTLATPLAILSRRSVLETVFGPDEAPKDFGLAGGGFWSLRPASFIAGSEDLHAAASDMDALRERYDALQAPVDILFGREDRILDPERHGQAFVGQAANARLELIDGGHMLPVTRASDVAGFIERIAALPPVADAPKGSDR